MRTLGYRRLGFPAMTQQTGSASPFSVADGGGETRAAILDVTYQLLEQMGYAAVTTDHIAAEARVSKATIYRLWRTKQALVVDAAKQHLSKADAPDLGSFRAEVHWVLEHRMRDYRDRKTLRLVAELVGASVGDPQLRELFEAWVAMLSTSLEMVIQRGVERGDVRSDLDTTALSSLIAGVVARTVVAQQPFDEEATRSIVTLVTRAAAP